MSECFRLRITQSISLSHAFVLRRCVPWAIPRLIRCFFTQQSCINILLDLFSACICVSSTFNYLHAY